MQHGHGFTAIDKAPPPKKHGRRYFTRVQAAAGSSSRGVTGKIDLLCEKKRFGENNRRKFSAYEYSVWYINIIIPLMKAHKNEERKTDMIMIL
jgi:hypothetical protein